MHRRQLLILVIVAILSWRQPVWAEQAAWKVGTAKACITPDKPLWMSGYSARKGPAEGTAHDLWVKALALEAADGHKAVLVAADLLGIPRAMYDKICEDLEEKCGLDRSQILLNCSHSHCTPVLADALFDIYPLDDNQRAMIEEYSLCVVTKDLAEAHADIDDHMPEKEEGDPEGDDHSETVFCPAGDVQSPKDDQ